LWRRLGALTRLSCVWLSERADGRGNWLREEPRARLGWNVSRRFVELAIASVVASAVVLREVSGVECWDSKVVESGAGNGGDDVLLGVWSMPKSAVSDAELYLPTV